MAFFVTEPEKCCDDCDKQCLCDKDTCINLPIKGSDVIYRGIPLDKLDIQNGDDYHKVILQIERFLKDIDNTVVNDFDFLNIGGGFEIFQKVTTDSKVLFKTIETDDSIEITDFNDFLYLKSNEKIKIFETLNDANYFLSQNINTNGFLFYIKSEDSYLKVVDNKMEDPFYNKLNKPNSSGSEVLYPYIILIDDKGESVKKRYSDILVDTVSTNVSIIAGNGLIGGGNLKNDVTIELSNETIQNINYGLIGYSHSVAMGNASTIIPDWSIELQQQINF